MRTNRKDDQLRPVQITPNIISHAEGSVLVEFGQTRVICTASVEDNIPKWLYGTKQGWVTAEYGMLPRSTHQRIKRDKALTGGRSQEISRLIGRSLRAVTNLNQMADVSVIVDCDVIKADGGTRTASITGGFVALALGLKNLLDQGVISQIPLRDYVAAVSVGMREGQILLDLDYEEDSAVDVDMNFVVTGSGQFVEIQGTAEKGSFSKTQMDQMTEYALKGCQDLFAEQKKILSSILK